MPFWLDRPDEEALEIAVAAGDPQLHTHVALANMTRALGRHTSLDVHALYGHKSAAGAVYRAVLRAELRER
jgi:hypothetical protein